MATLKEVYDAFKADGAPLPDTYERFESYMNSDSNRKKWYDAFKADGAPLPDTYEEFSAALFAPATQPEATSSQESTRTTTEGVSEGVNPVAEAASPTVEENTPGSDTAPTEQQRRGRQREIDQAIAKTNAMFERTGRRLNDMAEYSQKAGLNYGRVVESTPEVNVATGEINRTYLTPDLERTTDKGIAEMSATNFRLATDMSLGGQIRRTQQRLADLERRYEEKGAELMEQHKKNEPNGFFKFLKAMGEAMQGDRMGGSIGESPEDWSEFREDDEYQSLRLAVRKAREELQQLNNARDKQENQTGFWHDFGRSTGQAVFNLDAWDFGKNTFRDAQTMLQLNQRIKSGGELSDAEQSALNELYLRDNVFGQFGDLGRGYRWGDIAGTSLSFMKDFMLTGGFQGLTTRMPAELSKRVAYSAAQRMGSGIAGKKIALEVAEGGLYNYLRSGGRGAMASLLASEGKLGLATALTTKALGVGAEDLLIRAPMMAATVQGRTTAGKIIETKLGPVSVDEETGEMTFADEKGWGEAAWQAGADQIIENFSEMWGAHLPGVSDVSRAFGARNLTAAILRSTRPGAGTILSKTSQLLERAGMNGYFGEVGEEYYGQLWRTMLNLESAYDNGENLFMSGRFHGDIWGGMALSVGMTGGGAMAANYGMKGVGKGLDAAVYSRHKHVLNMASARASALLTPEVWDRMRGFIDCVDNSTMAEVVEDFAADKTMTDEQKSAVMDYAEKVMIFRGYNLGEMLRERAGESSADIDTDDIEQSFHDGYEATDPQEMVDAQNMYEHQRQRAEGILEPDILYYLDASPVEALIEMSRGGTYSQEQLDVARDYLNARTVRDAIIQRVNDNIDERIALSDAEINGRINNSSGMIQPATMGLDDRQVYIVGGVVAMTPEGRIDSTQSDESIIVRDAQTGKLEFTDPRSIGSLQPSIDPGMERAMAADTIRREAAQTAADAMNGVLAFNAGDVVTILGDEGLSQVTVLGPMMDEESGAPIDSMVVVQFADGSQVSMARLELQQLVDEANRQRINDFEQSRLSARAETREKAEQNFKFNDEITIYDTSGTPIRGSITRELDEDGMLEVWTEDDFNGQQVHRFTPQELQNRMVPNGQPSSVAEQNHEAPAESTEVMEVASDAESALSRIPLDEQGLPQYDEADADTVWDAIVEEAQGDEGIAAEVVADIVADRAADFNAAEKALAKIEEGKPEKRKQNEPAPTMAERIAAKKASKEALLEAKAIRDRAKQALEHWQEVAVTKRRREVARLNAEEEEAKRVTQERERQKAELEEAARLEREALNGVPDWAVDTPHDARTRGYRRNGPKKVDRPDIIDDFALGKEVEVRFGEGTISKGHSVVMSISQLEPSHRYGQRNPSHFLDEAQPKERKDAASRHAADKMAQAMRPEEITSGVTAYTGAPCVNSRGEVIQGNNRSEALRLMYESYPEAAANYREYLIEHAADFGLTPEAISAFDMPVVVNMLDVSDEEAIRLGQYVAQDTESGGVERIKPKNVVQKMGAKIKNFANLLLKSTEDDATMSQLVDANGVEVLKWMNQQNFITDTQYLSAIDSEGHVTGEGANDLRSILYQAIFSGGSTRLEEMFNKLPAKAQRAILATAFRDYDSDALDRMIAEIQQSIVAFNAMMAFEQFRLATNQESVQYAVEAWKRQTAFDDVSGEAYLPAETFSNFALSLAAMYKGATQRHMQTVFNEMYDIVQGTVPANIFDEGESEPRPLAQAIRQVLGIEYKPIKKSNSDGREGSIILDVNNEDGQSGRFGGEENADGTGQDTQGAESTDGRAGAETDGSVSSGTEAVETQSAPAADMQGAAAPEEGIESTSPAYDYEAAMRVYGIRGQLVAVEDGVALYNDSDGNRVIVLGAVSEDSYVGYFYDTQTGMWSCKMENHSADKASWQDLMRRVQAQLPTGALLYEHTNVSVDGLRNFAQQLRHGWELTDQTYVCGINGADKDNVLREAADRRDSFMDMRWQLDDVEGLRDILEPYLSALGMSRDAVTVRRVSGSEGDIRIELPVLRKKPVEESSETSHNYDDLYDSVLAERVEVSDDDWTEGDEHHPTYKRTVTIDGKYKVIQVDEPDSEGEYKGSYFEYQGERFGNIADVASLIDDQTRLAAAISAAESEVNINPTEGQKLAGNYKKGHVQVGTFDVTIEQPVGSVRRGTDADGKAWETTMRNTYGYIRGTQSVDGDHIDVFVSTDIDGWNGRRVVIIDQYNPDGSFDEHKVMLGFNDKDDAINAYLANYENGWENGRRLVFSSANIEDFEKWIESSRRKQKPYHEYKIADKAEVEESTPENPVSATSGVEYTIDTYTTKKNKTYHRVVFPHADKAVWQERLNLAKQMGGTSVPKGYGFKTREGAEAFAKAVADRAAVGAAQPLTLEDMRSTIEEVPSAQASDGQPEPGQPVNPSGNKLVTDERYAELRERMRRKLGGQLNMGVDPEILAIGTEMAVYHIEKGARKFIAYASAMIADLGDAIRPYLKSFYNAVRDMPEAEATGLVADMDSYDEVRRVDIANFDKSGIDAMATAAAVVAEQEAEATIKKNRRKKTSKRESKSTTDGGLFDTVEDTSSATPTIAVPEARPAADLIGDSAAYQEREMQTVELVEEIGGVIESRVAMLQLDAESVKPLTMSDIKKMAAKYSALKDISDTDLQELVELAMTQLSRSEAIVNVDGTAEQQRAAFDHIVNLYQIQPSLNARDSERLIKQQYSTPTPFGYVMGQFVRAGGKDVGSMLEPSAGNGALTITVHPSLVHVNDIDDARLANLRKLGYGRVTAQDALQPFAGEQVDVVMTNPPFGTVTPKEYDGIFRISSLEGQMAINALSQMKDDGRAAIVIGGNTNYRTNGSMNPKDAAFFGYLYSHYNVIDVINISGKALYSRNGTGYDVRMILIDGRKTGEFQRVFPPVKAKARAEQITTFDELYKRVQDDIQQIQQVGSQSADVRRDPGTSTDGIKSATVRRGDNLQDAGAGQRPDTASDAVRDTSGADSRQSATVDDGSSPAGVDNADSGDAGSTDDVPQSKPQQPRSVGSGSIQDESGRSGSDGRGATASRSDRGTERLEVKPDLTTEKVPYPNQSGNGFTLMSVVPAAQAQVLQKSLGEIGDVDQYLVDELGYSSKDELFSYLAAEQIDSVALAIHQMKKGNAFIIGDMTGVGKGRQGAALIRYAVKQGKVPIYFTQKPTLFTDNYRDLADIGSRDVRPFIIASNPKDANIVDADGNVVHKLPSKKEQERVFNYIMEDGTLPEEYDYVLTTYDQIKNGTADYVQNEDGSWNTEARKLPRKSKGYTTSDYNGQARRDALARLAEGNIAILDESHTVGGDSGCGRYMQKLTSSAGGVTFLSATFAKRADNMPIYAQRTAIAEAGVKASELIDAISKGGVTLQEIMSKQLVESGQMIRRERSFEGVSIDWLSVEEETNRRQREQFNEVADIFNAIRNFQDDYITPLIDAKNEAAAEHGATVGHTQGTKDLGVKNVPFASKMYNLVNQLLFALKVDAVADRVIENLRNGYKPVISFTNTMEGFLSSAPKGVEMDDVPNFSLTLMRALDGVMRFTEKDADENTEGASISLSELSAEGQNAYNAIREKIMNLSADLPISPMDAIRMKIEEAGYSVAEITGRTMQLNRTEDGRYIIEARKDRDKKAAMRDFNSGKLDVLMINKSGSTGISLHASSKFEDQRQRVMVFAQFQSDINDEVQMRGRIDRSGQVTRGRYEYIMSTIPAEQRIQMMFKAKLKSLDANTTSSQKSKFNEMEIVDYLNKYGDEVVWEYMKEHPELEERLGDPLDMLQERGSEDGPRTSENEDGSKKSGCAGKISRYLAFLSVEEQDEIFREITEAYRVKIQLLDDAGENDLEITTMPLRTETKARKVWHQGENPGSGNAFADNTYVEEVEADVLKKPMKRDEIVDAIRKLIGDHYVEKNGEVDWQHYVRAKGDEISQFFQSKADEAVGKLKDAGEARIAKAREKAVANATKARSRGENNFTDEEIQSLADAVANEARDKELQKQRKRQEEIMAVKHRIQLLLQRLSAGSIYVVPQDLKQGTAEMFSQTFGAFVGFKFNKEYTLGSSTAIFATLDGRRKVEVALRDDAINTILSATDIARRYSPKEIGAISMENWDSKVPTQTRQKRYIITGNLLQALVDTEKGEKTKGNLISYSTIDGETRQGILMGENFKLTDLRNSASLSSRLTQIREGNTVVSENGDVQIEKVVFGWQHRGQYELRVPKSKQRGGIYTMHTDLLDLVEDNNFITKGNSMVAYVTDTNIAKVVDMLSRAPFNLTVLQESQLTDSDNLERMGDGYGAYSDEEIAMENDPSWKVLGKSRFSKRRQLEFAARERRHMAERIEELASRMHLDNVEVVTDGTQLEGRRALSKGFYNKRTGKITIVIGNHVSSVDAEQTLLHEAVAHFGLRKLFGNHFNTFLDNVYESADESIRRKIAEKAARNGWDFRTATEEYLAELAENTHFETVDHLSPLVEWFHRVKNLFLDMLEQIGFANFRDNTGVVLTDNELRYILWRSYENLVEPGRYRSILGEAADVAMQSQLQVGNYADRGIEAEAVAEDEDLYRPGDFTPRDRVMARDYYERVIRSGRYQFREALQDSMLGLRTLYEAVLGGRKSGFRIEDVAGFENAYLYENRMSSMNAGEQHEYFVRYMKPLLTEIGRIAGANERKRRELTDYMMAKHGLERNAHMRAEAAANDEDTERDFAGLIGLTGEADWRSAEATAARWVADYEAANDTTSLWDAVNKATKATLECVYLSGLLSKAAYEKIRDMYEYYVPLRGWNETTSDKMYGYLTSREGPLRGSIMRKAEGRSSMADDPIATIAMMADDAIRQGNRNLMKQRFLNFVLNHPNDAVSVNDLWLEYDDVADEWRPVFADISDTDTAEEVAQKVEAFEQRMETLRSSHPDKYKKGREAQNIPYKVVHGNLREHQVLVKRNGRTYVLTINGNPRAAQALNGLTNPDVEQNGVVGNMLNVLTWANRQLSANFTTRNPDFVASNFFRDMLYSNCMMWVKESPRYALRFHKNFGRVNPVTMRRLLGKWEKGTLDMSDRLESMFYQFMKNGGETGYTNVRDIDGHKRAVAAELKKQSSTGRKAWTALGMQLDLLNRSAENCARFAAFMTSREFGRSIDRAIYDAKEVSVNFNKKGSGGKMVNANGQTRVGKLGAYLGGGGRLAYVFWNAGIQGMTNFGRQAKSHPAKFVTGAAALFTLGYVIPMLAQMLGGGDGDDDGKNAYYNFPEYVRRSNICFYAGDQQITIPLPVEHRAIYGLGELAYGVISGNEHYSNEELWQQMAAQVSQVLPLDMLEGGGGISPFIPSYGKAFSEAYIFNKGWTGLPVYKDTPFNKNDPEWTKAYASTDKHLVAFAKWLNEISGGDDFKKGSIDINPARIEYMLNGTFGGLVSFPNKIKKTVETVAGSRDFEWRNIPIANRLVKSGDERTAYRKLQNEYYKYLKEFESTGRLKRKYENASADGLLGYAEKVNFLENSPEYLRYEIFEDFKDGIDVSRKAMSEAPGKDERAQHEAAMYASMRELVNALHDPASYFQKLYDAGLLSEEYIKYLKSNHNITLESAKQE